MNTKEYREALFNLIDPDFMRGFLNLASESGEVLGVVKAAYLKHKAVDRDAIIDELGDVLASIEFILGSDDINGTMEEVRAKNIIKLTYREKYGKDKKKERELQKEYMI